jgi:hypothetical protein
MVVAVTSSEITLNLEPVTYCGPSPRTFNFAYVVWVQRSKSHNQRGFMHGVRSIAHSVYTVVTIPFWTVVVAVGCAATGDCI